VRVKGKEGGKEKEEREKGEKRKINGKVT